MTGVEVVGAVASALQIVGQSAQITMTIARYCNAVRTVDARIDNFVREVTALRQTYEGLYTSLQEPAMLEAARETNREMGGHLWQQMRDTLQDCLQTIQAINAILTKITASSGVFKPFLKQLKESLESGELFRLRERILIFNSGLQLPMQMLQLTVQLHQQQTTVDNQIQLTSRITRLDASIKQVLSQFTQSSSNRRESLTGTTLTRRTTLEEDWFGNMQAYLGTAKRFVDNASVAASTITQSVANRDDASVAGWTRRPSAWTPLTQAQVDRIGTFVDDLPQEQLTAPTTERESSTSVEAQPSHIVDSDSEDDTEIDLVLIKAQLKNATTSFEQGNYVSAEAAYRGALTKAQRNDFTGRIAYSAADITLMLCECCIKQQKYDEAIILLEPLSESVSSRAGRAVADSTSMVSSTTDRGQALSACHMLGQVYLQKSDFEKAQEHCLQAFRGRRRFLGKQHPKYRESILLVIDLYMAQDLPEEAEAYKEFLAETKIPPAPVPRQVSVPVITPPPSSPPLATSPPSRTLPKTSNIQTRPYGIFSTITVPSRAERTNNQARRLSSIEPTPASFDESVNGRLSAYSIHDVQGSSPFGSLEAPPTNGPFGSLDRTQSYNSAESSSSRQDPQRTSVVSYNLGSRTRKDTASTLESHVAQMSLEGRFDEIRGLCIKKKYGKAVDLGVALMKEYEPDQRVLLVRTFELKENIKKSKMKGLAGTGYGFSPLHFFCGLVEERVEEVTILLKHEVDVNAVASKPGFNRVQQFTPIDLAVSKGHESIVRLLLQHNAQWLGVEARTGPAMGDRPVLHPLLVSVQKGWIGIVDLLLKHGNTLTDENFPRHAWHGNSLLHEAAFRCNLDMVEYLLAEERSRRSGAIRRQYSFLGTPGQQDGFGATPIMYAVDMREGNDQRLMDRKLLNRIPCLKLLLEPATTDMNGNIVQENRSTALRDLHLMDKRGNTVFWYADITRGGDQDLLRYLDTWPSRNTLTNV